VLGIDPGTAVTGYGVVEMASDRDTRLVECGVIRTVVREPLGQRLATLHAGVAELIVRHQPAALALEGVF
jgi:crossover junction endodeoxyribonuclease RuvC